ncbi:AT-hook DNA-binding motif-containing protein 1 [Protopterus annectens]|uniref:AT-hook DNA-binding motif-containing protein 1 n=1 Tax=Protopterus annectens TaxID=7888 RepID=UPI001CFBA316|nr:AT-hook DNA-binding motif-containing protein 1 [Protopterus annectens]
MLTGKLATGAKGSMELPVRGRLTASSNLEDSKTAKKAASERLRPLPSELFFPEPPLKTDKITHLNFPGVKFEKAASLNLIFEGGTSKRNILDLRKKRNDDGCASCQSSGLENGGCQAEGHPCSQCSRAHQHNSDMKINERSLKMSQCRDLKLNCKPTRTRGVRRRFQNSSEEGIYEISNDSYITDCSTENKTGEDFKACTKPQNRTVSSSTDRNCFIKNRKPKRVHRPHIHPPAALTERQRALLEKTLTCKLGSVSNSSRQHLSDVYETSSVPCLDSVAMCHTVNKPVSIKKEEKDLSLKFTSGYAKNARTSVSITKIKDDRAAKVFSSATLISENCNINNIVAVLKCKCGNGQVNMYPVVQLIDIMKDFSHLSDLKNSGVHIDCDGLKLDQIPTENSKFKTAEAEDRGLQYSFFSSATLANSIRIPKACPQKKSESHVLKIQNLPRRTSRRRTSVHQNWDLCLEDVVNENKSKGVSDLPSELPITISTDGTVTTPVCEKAVNSSNLECNVKEHRGISTKRSQKELSSITIRFGKRRLKKQAVTSELTLLDNPPLVVPLASQTMESDSLVLGDKPVAVVSGTTTLCNQVEASDSAVADDQSEHDYFSVDNQTVENNITLFNSQPAAHDHIPLDKQTVAVEGSLLHNETLVVDSSSSTTVVDCFPLATQTRSDDTALLGNHTALLNKSLDKLASAKNAALLDNPALANNSLPPENQTVECDRSPFCSSTVTESTAILDSHTEECSISLLADYSVEKSSASSDNQAVDSECPLVDKLTDTSSSTILSSQEVVSSGASVDNHLTPSSCFPLDNDAEAMVSVPVDNQIIVNDGLALDSLLTNDVSLFDNEVALDMALLEFQREAKKVAGPDNQVVAGSEAHSHAQMVIQSAAPSDVLIVKNTTPLETHTEKSATAELDRQTVLNKETQLDNWATGSLHSSLDNLLAESTNTTSNNHTVVGDVASLDAPETTSLINHTVEAESILLDKNVKSEGTLLDNHTVVTEDALLINQAVANENISLDNQTVAAEGTTLDNQRVANESATLDNYNIITEDTQLDYHTVGTESIQLDNQTVEGDGAQLCKHDLETESTQFSNQTAEENRAILDNVTALFCRTPLNSHTVSNAGQSFCRERKMDNRPLENQSSTSDSFTFGNPEIASYASLFGFQTLAGSSITLGNQTTAGNEQTESSNSNQLNTQAVLTADAPSITKRVGRRPGPIRRRKRGARKIGPIRKQTTARRTTTVRKPRVGRKRKQAVEGLFAQFDNLIFPDQTAPPGHQMFGGSSSTFDNQLNVSGIGQLDNTPFFSNSASLINQSVVNTYSSLGYQPTLSGTQVGNQTVLSGNALLSNQTLMNTSLMHLSDAHRKYALRTTNRPKIVYRRRRYTKTKKTEDSCCNYEKKLSTSGLNEEPKDTSGINPEVEQPGDQGKRKRRGIRKMVVKVHKIPVFVGKRNKMTYKMSSLSSLGDKMISHFGGKEATSSLMDSTALLKMKNHGRNVMVMFPPGDLPVILKRKRGRPPKNPLLGFEKAKEVKQEVKKRRRKVKLPPPQPSYTVDTSDNKSDYADVLSKLAFLNKQNQTFGRCSPPRCWTPSDPVSVSQTPDTNNVSHFLQKVQSFRRRGGKAGFCGGRGGSHATETLRCSFSDFFEGIGKKRKVSAGTDHPRKRGRVQKEPSTKPVRRRRPRKNGALLKEPTFQNSEGALDWVRDSRNNWPPKQESSSNHQLGNCSYEQIDSRSFPSSSRDSSSGDRQGCYSSNSLSNQSQMNQDPHGAFAGYFRSLLDSDDSSDLIDFNTSGARQEVCKAQAGYTAQNSMQTQSRAPSYQNQCPKPSSNNSDNSFQSTLQMRQPYPQSGNLSFSMSQSPSECRNPETFRKLVSSPSISRSPTTHPPSGNYNQYPNFNATQNTATSNVFQQSKPYASQDCQGSKDCSFSFSNTSNVCSSPSSAQNVAFGSHTSVSHLPLNKTPYLSNSESGQFSSVSHTHIRCDSQSNPVSSGSFMPQKTGNLFHTSTDSCRPFANASQWPPRPNYNNADWISEGSAQHFNPMFDYGMNESNVILDISNYTPQKVKQRSVSETFSESSSDSTQLNLPRGYRRTNSEASSSEGGQSSLSSLEKLMMDWNETSSGPSYSWNQSILFQNNPKPGRGRRKKVDLFDSSQLNFTSASPFPSKRNSVPRQPRNPRGGGTTNRKERGTGRSKFSQKSRPANALFQESTDFGMDYYSGDSSMSPLPSQSRNFHMNERESCEFSGPYSVNPSTPSDETFAQCFPSEASSVSPSMNQADLDVKNFHPHPHPPPHPMVMPKLHHSFEQGHQKTFSNCSPVMAFKDDFLSLEGRKLPACETLKTNAHVASVVQPTSHLACRDLPAPHIRYDSPTLKNTNYWYSQSPMAGSPQYSNKLGTGVLMDIMERNELSCLSPHVSSPQVASPLTLSKPDKEPHELGRVHRSNYICPLTNELNLSPVPSDPVLPMQENYRYSNFQFHGQLNAPPKSGYMGQVFEQHPEDTFTVTSL